MLAGQLVFVAKTILNEYDEFKIIILLQKAHKLSAERASLSNSAYEEQSKSIISQCNSVIHDTLIPKLPSEISTNLIDSDISAFLPHKIAEMLIAGFPRQKEGAISSGEISMYINGANEFTNSLRGLVGLASKLNVEHYSKPDNAIGLNLIIPRSIINNGLIELGHKLKNHGEFLSYINELCSGNHEDPKISYISTTEPTFCIEYPTVTVAAILYAYKLFLEIAEKQLNLIKTIKDLRKSNMPETNLKSLEENVQTMLDQSIKQAVQSILDNIGKEADPHRKNEIEFALEKHSKELTSDIANGARIQLSIESRAEAENIPLLSSDTGTISEQLKSQKIIETRIQQVRQISTDSAQITHDHMQKID